MSTLSAILAAVLGFAFVAAGLAKLSGQERVAANFERWGYAHAMLVATGTVELLAGVLLLVGIAVTPLAITGVLLVVFVMVGALLTHQRAHDPVGERLPAAALLVLAFVLAFSLLP
jgi:putative oxidoreductase